MIRLSCTNCKTVLTIDDGFAGGVCRCQRCGTIQTVPSRLKNTESASDDTRAHESDDKSSKTLYQRQNHAEENIGTGLDQLAEVIAGSGLSRGGLSDSLPKPKPAAVIATPARRKIPWLAIAGIIILILIGIIIWLLLGR